MRHGAQVVDADLHAFADNTLPAERRTAILTALEADAAEARRVSDWCAQNEAIRRLLGKVVHEPVPVALLLTAGQPALQPATAEAFKPLAPRKGSPERVKLRSDERKPAGRTRGRISLCLAALCALVLASGWAGAYLSGARIADARFIGSGTDDPTTSFALRAAETYRTFAPDTQYPFEISAAQTPRLLQWFERRMGARLTVPKLTGLGFSYLGGRLVAWAPKHPAGLLIYQNSAGQRVALMFAKAKLAAELPFRHEAFQGVDAITWMQSGSVISVVGLPDPSELRSVATVAASEWNATLLP